MFISHARTNSKVKQLHVIILMVFKPFPFLTKQPIWYVTFWDFSRQIQEKIQFVLLFYCMAEEECKPTNFFTLIFFFPSLLKHVSCYDPAFTVSFLFLSVMSWSSELEASLNHHRHIALSAHWVWSEPQGPISPPGVQDSLSPGPFWGGGVSLSSCGSRWNPGAQGRAAAGPAGTWRGWSSAPGSWCCIQPGFPAPHLLSHKDTMRRTDRRG